MFHEESHQITKADPEITTGVFQTLGRRPSRFSRHCEYISSRRVLPLLPESLDGFQMREVGEGGGGGTVKGCKKSLAPWRWWCSTASVTATSRPGRFDSSTAGPFMKQNQPGAFQYHSRLQITVEGGLELPGEGQRSREALAQTHICSLPRCVVCCVSVKMSAVVWRRREKPTESTNDEEFQAFTRMCTEFQPACRWK